MTRLRHRPDYFMWRGDEYDFHRLQDGPSLACLDRHIGGEQEWPLHSGRTIFPTGEEVRSIIKQVHGLSLPSGEPEPPAPSLSPTPEPIERIVSDPSDKERIAELEEKLRRVSAALDAATKPPPEPELFDDDGIPEAFRSLMLPGESPEKFTERMRRRLQALRHLQMDGTKPTPARALPDMTPEESEELADLERRNSQHKWLD